MWLSSGLHPVGHRDEAWLQKVAQTAGGFEWRSDRARKLTSYIGSAPVVGAAVGLGALGVGEAQKDVLRILDEVLNDERPLFGVAAGAGPWTSKSVAHAALQEAGRLLGGADLGKSVVLARVADWQAGAANPTMWGFELRSVEVDEDGLTTKMTSSSTTTFESLALAGLCSVPESTVWQLVRDRLDRTTSLLHADVEVDDPRLGTALLHGGGEAADRGVRVCRRGLD